MRLANGRWWLVVACCLGWSAGNGHAVGYAQSTDPEPPEPPPETCDEIVDPSSGRVECVIGDETGEPGSGGGSPAEPDPIPHGFAEVSYSVVVETVDGPCTTTESAVIAEVHVESYLFARGLEYEAQVAAYPAGVDPTVPCGEPDIADAVRAVVRRIAPQPEILIAPGWGIAGLRAYLETNRDMVVGAQTVDVPLGASTVPVTVTMTGSYDVDWGDGTVETRLTVPGRPYDKHVGNPDSHPEFVSHVYTVADTYEVLVTDHWTVTFERPGFGASTILVDIVHAPYEHRVDEIQAVITDVG